MEPIFIIMALVDIKNWKATFSTHLCKYLQLLFSMGIYHENSLLIVESYGGYLRRLFSVRICRENLTLLFLDTFSFLIVENSFFSETFFGTWWRLRATVVSSFQRNFPILHVGLLKQLMITILSNQMKDFCF